MLPELLFSVGNSMQDISRDDFSLLNGECEKDVSTARSSPLALPSPAPTANNCYNACSSDTPPPPTTATTLPSNIDNNKLEDSNSSVYSIGTGWHHNSHHQHSEFESTKLLLQNSDDPLISRGAANDDDNPNELKSIAAASTAATGDTKTKINSVEVEGTSKPTKTTIPKRNRNSNPSGNKPRRKSTFKLRFHHQALPPEYLSHYEMTQNQLNKANTTTTNSTSSNNKSKNSSDQTETGQESGKRSNAHETVRSWLEKISQLQTNTANNQKDSVMDIDDNANENAEQIVRSPRKVVKYSDLPYMGEMTLENSKPRRGRKPKKADICHLIYKNYGTIIPGTPMDKVEIETRGEIKQSLLEKCLSKDLKELNCRTTSSLNAVDEPLNLCLRDQSGDSFTLSSDDEASDELVQSTRASPITPQSDPVTDAILAANLKMSLPNFQSALLNNKSSDDTPTPSTGESDQTSPPNYPYWSNTGVFLHPMALYYQKIIDSQSNGQSSSTSTTTTTQSGVSKSIQTKNNCSPKSSPKLSSPTTKKDKSEHIESCSTPSSTRSTTSTPNSSSTQNQSHPAPKRKRSAIFIPPMPAENTTNPATEVSICKFKFTGGAKPTLQEKKMLSVDSDGNYRYYSGTGDKSMRGYEFFPRETLQQSGVVPGVNCSGAFLNATGEKIPGDFPPSSSSLSVNNELLQLPDSPAGSLLLSNRHRTSPILLQPDQSTTPPVSRHHRLLSSQASDRRKRKSRRSIQREKLEQTFKEKGFLIQTQQLESAEGATYCKFRQLRKFTRYLFRSWKDYLPGDIQQANAAAVAAAAAAAANQQSCRMIESTSDDGDCGDAQRSPSQGKSKKNSNNR